MAKTRDLFKKIRDTKGTFHAKMGSISEVAQSCPTLSDPMDCSLPGSSVHGIFQADDPVDAGNLISGSSTFSKTSLNI